ncbi:sugar transporter domain-containing protein [Ditylenchus destructor]|uniref:Sugar transporter domain-containing protein n=1 Tax=Ditylenchus destructor TaxID=166010 RepID=A0AAD4R5P1_9BILA|nr:sugar transporter domain-containing protein [Ditylenchus destructor]
MTEPDDGKTRLTSSTAAEQQEKLITRSEQLTSETPQDASKLQGRLTPFLLFTVFAITFGSAFQFGYHIGCVNAPGKLITQWFRESYFRQNNQTLSADTADFLWSLSVGIFALSGMIGGLLSGLLADKMGRKGALLFNNLFAFIAAALLGLAKFVDCLYLIPIGRFVIGFNCGLNSGLVPMYLTEVSPINLRGTLGSVNQLMITVAILVSQILGLPFILGNVDLWPYIFVFTVVPALTQLATLPFCPESPKYNLIVKGKKDQAEKDLKRLRAKDDVSGEVEIMEEEAIVGRSQPKVSFKDMFGAALRWPLLIAVMMMLSQQLSGINAAMFYSTQIFSEAGLTENWPFYATIAMGFINVVQTMISVWLVDHPKFGRRSLHLIGLVGMAISSLLIVASMILAGEKTANGQSQNQWASYASIVFVLLFVVSFATGPGSIPWFFVSELFPSNARGNANSIAVAANWLANGAVGISFLPLNNMLGKFTFLVFVGFLSFFILFTYKFVPETKGKTVEQINQEMNKKNKNTATISD